jgi:hypothetical protein
VKALASTVHKHTFFSITIPLKLLKTTVQFCALVFGFALWPIAHNKIPGSGPLRRRTLEAKFLGEFESIFETALDHESGDQLGTFGEITLDKKISCYCPLKVRLV